MGGSVNAKTQQGATTPQSQKTAAAAPIAASSSPTSAGECYHYNPYNTECSRVQCQQAALPTPIPQVPSNHSYADSYSSNSSYASQASTLPFGTLHMQLEGRVSFVPYPTEEFYPPVSFEPKENMSRVFIGQLPYQVTDMQLDWLCFTFGGGRVYYPERITKHDTLRGCKVPTGCIHAYCEGETAAEMLNAMHKRILVDDTGVWFAESPDQQFVLNDYCHLMKLDRTRRFQNRPYDTVVAQFATSNYVPSRRR